MTSGKELFKATLSGERGARPAFLLHANPACASFARAQPAAFRRDPEMVRATLAELQQVCGADAITAVYDPTVEDEAFSSVLSADVDLADVEALDLASHPALAASFDATNRLVRTAGQRSAAICGVLSGPISAATRLLGPDRLDAMLSNGLGPDVFDSFSAPLTTVLRRLCELGVDAVALREDLSVDTTGQDYVHDGAFAYRMMNAVARHYKVPLIFVLNAANELPASVRQLEVDVVSLPLELATTVAGLTYAVHDRVPDEWLAPGDGDADEHARVLAQLDPSGRVIEAEWSGEGRVPLERLMRLGHICGSLRDRVA